MVPEAQDAIIKAQDDVDTAQDALIKAQDDVVTAQDDVVKAQDNVIKKKRRIKKKKAKKKKKIKRHMDGIRRAPMPKKSPALIPGDRSTSPTMRKPIAITDEDKEGRKARLLLASAARLKTQILKARKHPGHFIEFVMRDHEGKRITLAPFHWEWLEAMMTKRRLQIEAAKSHGKTTLLLGYICWKIGTNPEIRLKMFTQSDPEARKRLGVVTSTMEAKLYKLVFPWIKPLPGGLWTKTAITVDRNSKDKEPTLSVIGILGSVEGGRSDEVIFDDIADFRTSIMFPKLRSTIKNKVYAEILPTLDPKGRAISIGTPHHELDITASLRKNPTWISMIYPVGTSDDPHYPLWPERMPRHALELAHQEFRDMEYNRAFRLIYVSQANQIIPPEKIAYYTADMLGDPWRLLCVQVYDLASSKSRKSSYFACVTFLFDRDKNIIFVADAWHAKLNVPEQADRVLAEAKRWQPAAIGLEETGYQSALRALLVEKTKDTSTMLNIIPISPGSKSKEIRLADTLPMFEAKRIFFNPTLDPTNPDLVDGNLIGEIITFATSEDKDLGDAFAHGVKLVDSFKRTGDDDSNWDDGEGVATRLSILGED